MQTTEFNHLESAFLNLERRPDTLSVHVEVRVTGRMDAARLTTAIRAAMQTHPIARARIRYYEGHALRNWWEIPDEPDYVPLTVIDAADDAAVVEARSRLQSIQVPLSLSPCFMVYLVHHADGDWLMLNVHHAMGDGLSTFRIMTSILRNYAGEADPVPDFDPLSVRDLKKLAGSLNWKQRLERVKMLLELLGKGTVAPARVQRKGVSAPKPDEVPGYAFELLPFSPEETKQFMARREKPATVNDMLLAGLALTIQAWNAQHGGDCKRVAIMMPVNLRPEAWWFEVVTNFSSYVSVSVSADQLSDLSATTHEVCQMTTELKEAGAAGVLIDVLEVPKLFPAIIKARLREFMPLFGKATVESTVLSNLGRLAASPDVGDAGKVAEIYFSPPASMPIGVSVGAASMEDRMFLTLRYRKAQFNAEAAREFGALYRQILLG